MPFNVYDTITIGTGNILENEEFKIAKTPAQEVSDEKKYFIIFGNFSEIRFSCSSNNQIGKSIQY
jgi:hypothetical protein